MQDLSINEIVEQLKIKLESKNLERIETLEKQLEKEKECSRKRLEEMKNYYEKKISRLSLYSSRKGN